MALSLATCGTRDRDQQLHNATWQDYVALQDSDAIDGVEQTLYQFCKIALQIEDSPLSPPP